MHALFNFLDFKDRHMQPAPTSSVLQTEGFAMATKQTSRGRRKSRACAEVVKDDEARFGAKKPGESRGGARQAVKRVGNSRLKVERELTPRLRDQWLA
jgi:hypothetical protein